MRPPRQVPSFEYQHSRRNDISEYLDALRDMMARKRQFQGQYLRLLNDLAVSIMDVSWLNYPSLLPLYNNCTESVVSPRSLEFNRIIRPDHVPDTQSQDQPVQSRVETPGQRSNQQDVPIGSPSTIPRRRLNVRNPLKEKCDKQMEKVLEVLGPIMPEGQTDSQWILLCCGKPDQCQIIPVKISLSADSVIVWHEIQQAWNIYTGSWRRNIPFFGVRKVSVVDVS